jgi:hypothetical protein
MVRKFFLSSTIHGSREALPVSGLVFTSSLRYHETSDNQVNRIAFVTAPDSTPSPSFPRRCHLNVVSPAWPRKTRPSPSCSHCSSTHRFIAMPGLDARRVESGSDRDRETIGR